MKLYFFMLLVIIIIIINKNENKEIKYVDGLGFQLKLYSNEHRYYNRTNALYDYRKPYGYVKIHNESEIVDVIAYAKSICKTVSIRSGGHGITSLSVLNDTINLDMSGMKGIIINQTEKTVVVQSGVLLGELYEELLKHGLISTGGTCPDIGMGIALAGGMGYFTNKHGYMIDNIIEHTIVLANGDIVKANKRNEYSDLHWALLGSGHGGFGIVTDFTMKVHDSQPLYYHNQIIIQYEHLAEAILTLYEYVENLTDNKQKSVLFDMGGPFPNSNKNTFIMNLYYMDGPTYQGDIHFNNLLKLVQQSIPNAITNESNKNEKTYMELVDLSFKGGNHIRFIILVLIDMVCWIPKLQIHYYQL